MKNIKIKNNDTEVSQIAMGCMRLNELDFNAANELVMTAIDSGINFFDHADIYGGGECETLFGKIIKENNINRDKIFVQSKASIRNGYYDYSKEHITNSVDGILKRLGIDYLDYFLLHRPDTLFEGNEVGETFEQLKKEGKVKHFGVSNNSPMSIELLKKYVKEDIVVNQLQLSITNSGMIDFGLSANTLFDSSINRDGQVLEYCRLNDIAIQAWSPFQYGFFDGIFIDNEKYPELNKKLEEVANNYNTTKTAIATAWILRHPANIQMLAGTTNKNRLKEIADATNITLTREEWYNIYTSSGKILP